MALAAIGSSRRLWTRLGLPSRLAILAAAVIVLALALVIARISATVGDEMALRAQQSLDVNLKLGLELLKEKGQAHLDGDKLVFGDYVANGNFEVVDKVKAIAGGTATIFMNDKEVAKGRIDKTVAGRFGIDTFGIGEDSGAPVVDTYEPLFRFTGTIEKVTIDLK